MTQNKIVVSVKNGIASVFVSPDLENTTVEILDFDLMQNGEEFTEEQEEARKEIAEDQLMLVAFN